MKISVVVSTFNRRVIVGRTVQTLFEQDLPSGEYEVIVVVDGSTDGTTKALRAMRPACTYRVLEQENRGLAGARNTGWRSAASDIVLFLDDDMLCDSSLVATHFDAQTQLESAIGLGAIVLESGGRRTVANECFNREVGAYSLRGALDRERLPLADCNFANTSLRKRWLEKSGGFDERYRMREDLELAVRLSGLGVHPLFLRRAVARQIYNKTAADLVRDSEAFADADMLFLGEHTEAADLTFAGKIARERRWKRTARRLAAAAPIVSDSVVRLLARLGDKFSGVPWLFRVGVRALQVQRGMHYYRRVLGGRLPPGNGERK